MPGLAHVTSAHDTPTQRLATFKSTYCLCDFQSFTLNTCVDRMSSAIYGSQLRSELKTFAVEMLKRGLEGGTAQDRTDI